MSLFSMPQSTYLPVDQEFPSNEKLLLETLVQRDRITASIVNIKENAQYEKQEIITGQQWFSTAISGAIKTGYSFRVAFDLVSLNRRPIPAGVTNIALQADPDVNTPVLINYANTLIPVHGFGAATIGTTLYFVNDPLIFVRFINISTAVQSVQVTNNTGSPITQFYWVFEYLKT